MLYEVLECCGNKITTGSSNFKQLDCFISKKVEQTLPNGSKVFKEKFFKKNLKDGRPIKKEIILVAVCPNCKHYILKILWYANKKTNFHDWAECKDIKGNKADEIFLRRADYYEFYDIPDPAKDLPNIKHSKKIPWVYYKATGKETQVPRYIDESDNAGRQIYSKLKLENI